MSDQLAVTLSGQTTGFSTAMEKAEGSLEHLNSRAASVGESLKGKLEGLGSVFSGGGLEGALSSITGSFGGVAESAGGVLSGLGPVGIGLGVVAGAAALAATAMVGLALGIKSIVEPQMEAIDANYKLARSFDVPIDALMTFHNVAKREAGLASEDVDIAMKKLAKNIGEAVEDPTSKAAKSFANLGLSAKDLANGGLDKAFTTVVDKLSEVHNTALKAADSTEIFGKSGLVVAAAFHEGAEGINAAHDAGLKMGTVLSQMDAAKVHVANEAFERVSAAITGVENKITVALAPVIEYLGEKIQSLIPSTSSFESVAMGAVKVVAYGVAGLIDTWSVLKAGVLGMAYVAVGAFEGILRGVNAVGEGVVWLANKLGANWKMPTIFSNGAETAKAMRDSLGDQINDALSHSAIDKVPGFLDAISKHGNESAVEAMKHDMTVAGTAIGDEFANSADKAAKKAKEKLATIMEGLDSDLSFQKYLQGDTAGELRGAGVSNEQLKKIHEAGMLGGGSAANDATKKVLELAPIETFNKGEDAIQKLHERLTALQSAANSGLDPKLAEEIAKLKLTDDQAKRYEEMAEGIKKLEDASKVKDKIKDLREEVEALQKGMTVEEYKLSKNATPEQQAEIKKLDEQKKALTAEKSPVAAEVRRFALDIQGNDKDQIPQQQLEQQRQQTDYLNRIWQQGQAGSGVTGSSLN